MIVPDLRERRVVVLGLGLFGGGVAAARHLVRAGARVLVTDLRSSLELRESLLALESLPIEYRLGGHRETDFDGAELVVANPAVPPDSPWLDLARERGIPVTSEFALALRACPGPVVAVTGTNGKSTTTALVGSILREAGRPFFVGGNIGRSLLDHLDEVGPDHTVVLEASSYQLEALDAPAGFPRVAVVTNLTPDHLDRHRTMQAYGEAKARILARQGPADAAVLNGRDEAVSRFAERARARALFFARVPEGGEGVACDRGALLRRTRETERAILEVAEIPLIGDFNVENAAAAATATLDLGLPLEAVAEGIRRFRGLPHRLEFLGERDGLRFFDNAVSTVPEPTIEALRAIPPPILLVAGGKSKGLPLAGLVREIRARAHATFLYGAAAPELASLLAADRGPPAQTFGHLEEAVEAALRCAKAGDAVLYSPSFTSFDQYRNFLDRAAHFRRLVGLVPAGAAS